MDRNWEWFYLDRLLNSEKSSAQVSNQVRAATGRQDFGNVVDVAFLDDGRCLSAFKSGSKLTILDVSSERKLSDISASGGINLAHLSDDGRRAYTNNAYGFEIFDTLTGEAVIQLPRDRSWQEVVLSSLEQLRNSHRKGHPGQSQPYRYRSWEPADPAS